MKKLKRKQYEKHLEPMQLELVAMARWLAHTGKRVLVLPEGRDTAGQGGAINANSEHVNPRQCRVVALPKPHDRAATPAYFPTYSPDLRHAAEPALFDTSWHTPAGLTEE